MSKLQENELKTEITFFFPPQKEEVTRPMTKRDCLIGFGIIEFCWQDKTDTKHPVLKPLPKLSRVDPPGTNSSKYVSLQSDQHQELPNQPAVSTGWEHRLSPTTETFEYDPRVDLNVGLTDAHWKDHTMKTKENQRPRKVSLTGFYWSTFEGPKKTDSELWKSRREDNIRQPGSSVLGWT